VHVAPLFLLEAIAIIWFQQVRWDRDSRLPGIIALVVFPLSMIALVAAAIIARRGWRLR
jgi:hypothetical protein